MAICKPEDSIEQCARRWRQALRQRESEARARLLQEYGQVYKWLKGELEALLQDLAAAEQTSPWHLVREQRYKALLAQAEAEMQRLAGVTDQEVAAAQYEAMAMSQQAVTEQLRAAGVSVAFDAFPYEAFQALVGVMADGTPLMDYLGQSMTAEALAALRQSLLSGLVAGWNPRRVARLAAQKATGLALSRALTIARTEMLRAYREGARMRYAEAGIEEWVWLSAQDRRTCPACLALHGQRFKVEEPQRGHPNCRCTMVPAIAGVDYGIRSGEEWLRKQLPGVQDEILGKAGGLAFRAGAVRLDDFVGRKHSTRWGAMYYRRSLAEILGKGKAEEWKRKWREQYWGEIKRWREQAQNYREYLEETLGFASRWNGKLVYRRLPSGAVGAKEWQCTIALDKDFWQSATEEQKRHVLIHEMLHSLSPGLTPSAYRLHRGWEEGVVEQLSYVFYRRIHHEADGWATGYAHYIEALEGARRALEMPEDDFYLWLFHVALPSRETALFRKGEELLGQKWYTVLESLNLERLDE